MKTKSILIAILITLLLVFSGCSEKYKDQYVPLQKNNEKQSSIESLLKTKTDCTPIICDYMVLNTGYKDFDPDDSRAFFIDHKL